MRLTTRWIAAVLALFALAGTAAACGDDDGGGGAQGDVADLMIESLSEFSGEDGVEIDEGCIRDIADQLSDEDAEALVDAGLDGDPDVSSDGEALGAQMIDCVDLGDLGG